MSSYFEIAYAAASNRLCIFTGTGFSKSISTNEEAPSWEELLRGCLSNLESAKTLEEDLFPEDTRKRLPLEEIAEIIAIELKKNGRDLHDEIAEKISAIELESSDGPVSNFLKKHPFRAITTNYDLLIETILGEQNCISITPGLPIPRANSHSKIYHVHGSIKSPQNMVVTSSDYFNFINRESYFSRKLSTTLHENTVVILGYSLSDTNLKAILNDYKQSVSDNRINYNIFFVSRNTISDPVKEYYENCYGIRVIDNTEIETFFENLETRMDEAIKCAGDSKENLQKALTGDYTYSNDVLKVETSLFEITAALPAIGKTYDDTEVIKLLTDIIDKKQALTRKNSAWEQYVQLARWLAYLAGAFELRGTQLEESFLNATIYSMSRMSQKMIWGRSWQSYPVWKKGWAQILNDNKRLIKEHLQEKETDKEPDIASVIAQ